MLLRMLLLCLGKLDLDKASESRTVTDGDGGRQMKLKPNSRTDLSHRCRPKISPTMTPDNFRRGCAMMLLFTRQRNVEYLTKMADGYDIGCTTCVGERLFPSLPTLQASLRKKQRDHFGVSQKIEHHSQTTLAALSSPALQISSQTRIK